jgi:hypothetical protein
MSDTDTEEFYVHTASAEPFLFTNSLGVDLFGPAVTVPGFNDTTRRQVRSADGQIVISAGSFYTYPANASSMPIDARVTIDGSVTRVMTSTLNTSGALDLPDHLDVTLV